MSETPEQRKARLRWLTLAEIVAIVAVTISGIGLWKSWQDGQAKPTPVVIQTEKSISLTLRAAPDDDRRAVTIAAVEPRHAVQSTEIVFPTALGEEPFEQSGDMRLAASGFDDPLFKARDSAGLPKLTRSEGRLPLLIVTSYVDAGAPREDRALYDLGYRIADGGLFGGRELSLGGLSLVTRGKGATQAALDRRWSAQAR
ncbi:MAG: hypothetical protein M3Q83_03475 [Pseudomonadota bacterium]|nr:hypothetical protein [Pseudomonadota bacterium]